MNTMLKMRNGEVNVLNYFYVAKCKTFGSHNSPVLICTGLYID